MVRENDRAARTAGCNKGFLECAEQLITFVSYMGCVNTAKFMQFPRQSSHLVGCCRPVRRVRKSRREADSTRVQAAAQLRPHGFDFFVSGRAVKIVHGRATQC